ncbi:SDR family NAD(P)-dependent oxidoreductase [Nocardia sp. NPDC052112]|uniref:SDR family NAD(P)-dependent oxidoreductase n=1 Tax=Nocardia sp. NPDC052112 TaxID=3155646 RepID=UPI00341A1A4E
MSTPQESFGGGVAVITGAGAGIGAGLARYAALELGMRVMLADIDAQAIVRLRAELESAGAVAVEMVCDVRDPDAVQRLADRVIADMGAVRLLVNNAGVEQFGYLWDTSVCDWNRLVAININGVFHGIRSFLPRLMGNPAPSWVWNLSSVGGVVPWPLQAPYIMSKHAILALTECLHQEVEMAGHGDHVRVQAVLPGAVVSNIFDAAHGVDVGDVVAAEAQRTAMLAVKAAAMDPQQAAKVLFEQAISGVFYLLTQPDSVGAAMDERAETLRSRRAPTLPRGSRYSRAET